MHLTSLESHLPQDRCGTPSFAATVLSRSALGLDASTFNASACYRLRGGCATASEYYLIWLAGFASSRGEVMGMLCYSVVKEQKRDFSPSLFLHNTKRLKRNALKKIFYEFLKLPLVFADNLLGYAVLFCHSRRAGFLFSAR